MNIFESRCPNCEQFSAKFFRVWKPEFPGTICHIDSGTSWRLL